MIYLGNLAILEKFFRKLLFRRIIWTTRLKNVICLRYSYTNSSTYRLSAQFYNSITFGDGWDFAAIPAALLAYIIFIDDQKFSKGNFFLGAYLCAASFATGVGLAAAATAISPSIMLGMGSAALAGAAIGVISSIAALCVVIATVLAAEKVNEYIISPVIEHFSSKGEESNLPAK